MSKVKLTAKAKEIATRLTALQRDTVINLVSGMNQRQAYVAAGGSSATDESADSAASKLLSLDKVAAFHQELLSSASRKAVMSRQEAMEKLSIIARTNIDDVIEFSKHQVGEDYDGEPIHQSVWEVKGSDTLTKDQASAITEVTASKDGLKIKTHSQTEAIKQLATMEGWNAAQKHEVKSEVSVSAVSLTDEQLMAIAAGTSDTQIRDE